MVPTGKKRTRQLKPQQKGRAVYRRGYRGGAPQHRHLKRCSLQSSPCPVGAALELLFLVSHYGTGLVFQVRSHCHPLELSRARIRTAAQHIHIHICCAAVSLIAALWTARTAPPRATRGHPCFLVRAACVVVHISLLALVTAGDLRWPPEMSFRARNSLLWGGGDLIKLTFNHNRMTSCHARC